MSASSIPYHIRPHKAVDRRLFLDLLNRCERWRPLSRDTYLSMGAYPLEDHRLIHRMLGITRLIAFDSDKNIVERQKFNRPLDSCKCITLKSDELIEKLDTVLSDADCADPEGLIIWLDYTSPSQLGEQIREFESLLDKLGDGDILRVTVNAHLTSLGEAKDANGKQLQTDELRTKRFEKLQKRIGDYFPSDARSSHMTPDGLAYLIAKSFGKASSKALPVSGSRTFAPLSIVRYSDGHQMLSMTGMILDRQKKTELRNRLDMSNWPFSSSDWETIHSLEVPNLTLRERLFLERAVSTHSHEEIAEELGFEFEKSIALPQFLENYRDFYRFYPTLLQADV